MGECSICFEAFNKTSRKSITCTGCSLSVCRHCVIRNIKEQPADIACMGCNQIWSRQFLSQVMTKAFMNREYKHHRENMLFDKQRACMEATLPYVESVKRKRKLQSEIDSLYSKLDEINNKIRRVNEAIDEESRFFNTGERSNKNEAEKTERLFSRGHCIKENCNGLIDNTWKCSSCETPVCNRCMKERVADHLCLREDIQSMRLIRNDSKPCPSCGVRIHLFSGCSQAWCTQCNTAFNWRTLKLIKSGFFHNPHYAEWQERNGGDPRAVANYRPQTQAQCVDYNMVRSRVIDEIGLQTSLFNNPHFHDSLRKMRGYLMAANHIMDQNTQVNDEEFAAKFRQLRTAFLMNEMDENQFKVAVQRVDKAQSKKRELCSVFEMYATVTRDIIAKWARDKEITMDECKAQIDDLYKYTKGCIKNIHLYYQPFSKHTGNFTNNLWYTNRR